MEKKRFVFVVIVLLLLLGVDGFAQSANAQLLQGEWLLVNVKDGNEIFDLDDEGIDEFIWKFEGNTFIQLVTQEGYISVEIGTVYFISNYIIFEIDGYREPGSYSIQGNTLTMEIDGLTYTFRKR